MKEKVIRKRLGEGLKQDKTDWGRISRLTDKKINAAIKKDPDALAVQPSWMENAMILRPNQDKERLTVRFDADMVEWFKKQGRGYQTRMNAVLRSYYEACKNPPPK
ncbi:MAG: BrnA antitoxin family protein [Nitrospinae bacterium]|nr:BrnA antitoxin family protein [Nitrospinota bacterium]